MTTDKVLRQDVIDEFTFDPTFNGDHIGVAVDKNVVSLSGHVGSYAEKIAVLAAVRRIKGVRGIAENIDVRYPNDAEKSDDQIAHRILEMMKWDVLVPAEHIDVLVQDGWVTLNGKVAWHYQKTAAEENVRKLSGVRGVTNKIIIKPVANAKNVKATVDAALKRHAEVEAGGIRVAVKDDNKIILEGKVSSWDERLAVEKAVWSAPGVVDVDDRLTID